MAIPLISYNPCDVEDGMPKRIIIPELVYLFEKN